MTAQLIRSEAFTSVKDAQAGLTRLLKRASKKGRFYRVMRNNKPVGVLVPNDLWEELVEDLEALTSSSYLESIRQARRSRKRYSSKQVKKLFNF